MIELGPNGEPPEDGHGHFHVGDFEHSHDHEVEVEPHEQHTLLFFKQKDKVVIFIVRHSHWDYSWFRARFESAMREVQRIRDIVEAGLPYTFEQTATVDEFHENVDDPELKTKFLERIQDGTFEMIPLYIQQDEFLGCEESMFWNIELGMRDIAKMGGKPSRALYGPDNFGHYRALPKVARHAGFDNYIFARGFGPEVENGAIQRGRSDDGSEILLIPMQGSYDNGRGWYDSNETLERKIDMTELAVKALMSRFEHRYEVIDLPHMVVGNGSDFTKLDTELQGILEQVQQVMVNDFPGLEFQFGSYEEYVDLVKESVDWDKLPVYEGELRSGYDNYVLRGVDSTGIPLKQLVQSTEREIWAADTMTALLWLGRKYGQIPEGSHLTEDQIQSILLARRRYAPALSHDAVCRCGTDDTYPHIEARLHDARGGAVQVQRNIAAALESKEDTYGIDAEWGYDVSVINTLPQTRTALVEIPMAWVLEQAQALTAYAIIDGQKVDIPVQIEQKVRQRYAVCAVPLEGLSATNITLVPVEKSEVKPSFESEFYAVTVGTNGTVHITDKKTGVTTYGNVIEDVGDRGDEYNFCPVEGDEARTTETGNATVTVLHDGPAFTELQIDTELVIPEGLDGPEGTVREVETRSPNMVTVPISTRVRLINGVDRVEFATTIDNTARDHRLRVRFGTPNAGDTVKAKEPYEMITRDAVPIKGGDNWAEKLPIPTSHNQNLITIGDLALYSKGLPEYEALTDENGNITEVALTLLRSVGYLSRGNMITRGDGVNSWAGPGAATPDAQYRGVNVEPFQYAISLRGQQSNSDVIQQANDYLHTPKFGPQGDRAKDIGARMNGILNFDAKNVVMSAVRVAPDGNAVLARFYNPNSEPKELSLNGVFTKAVRANAFGKAVDDTDARNVTLRPGEIVTVRLS